MSGAGSPTGQRLNAEGLRVGLVASRWHEEIVDRLVARAVAAAEAMGTEEVAVVRVAGAGELPVVVQELARQCDAVVALGAVVRGGTPHFEYVCSRVTSGLLRVALDEGVPVADGVLTCDTVEQARDRAGFAESVEDKGWEAMIAAVDAALALQSLRGKER
jgi:6,7-dimethyl-8-ribityllumazine synthase